MNIYKCLNEITQYIEDNLTEKIDYEVLARMMGVNSYTMQRIFSLLAGVNLSEYIRKRKLSCAGYDLYEKKYRIIDIALKYGYEHATSFSRAFEAFHGIKPSLVSKEFKLKSFPRIVFNEDIKIVNELDYEIKEIKELVLYGVGKKTNNKNIGHDAPEFFKEMRNKYLDKYGEIKYGMVTYQDVWRDNCNYYYVLYDKKIEEFEKITIPKSKWLIFKLNSQQAKDIQEISHKFYLEFLPSCKYNLRDIPELEYYHDGVTEFLVAID